jgi:Histidine kinase
MKTEIVMFRAIGNFLHKTPWWALLTLGLATLLFLAMFTTPFNVIRLSDSGHSSEERRAIKREIQNAFGDSALGAAEGIVRGLRARTQDPAQKAEFDQALEDIAEARKDLLNVQVDVQAAVKEAAEAAREASQEATQGAVSAALDAARSAAEGAAQGALNAARDAARKAAESQRDAAQERLESLTEARQEALDAQKKAGITDKTALASFDSLIASAKDDEKTANDALAKLADKNFSITISTDAKARAVSPVAPSTPAPPAAPKAPAAPSAKTSKNSEQPGINIDGTIGGKPVKGKVVIGGSDKPMIALNLDDGAPLPPLPPLPADLREDIREKARGDFRRLGIGTALILIFIPLFLMTMIAKFLIDRSRRAQAFAEVKKQEAESANVNRQIVEARLQALQAQVEPHFLYNTLANVQALTEVDPPQANKMVGHLIQYLRAALPKMRENTSTVGQEVDLVRAYLNILKIRMGPRLEFAINVPIELNTLPFPPLMLPSLVENAIKHGLEPQREGGRIDVEAVRVGDTIRMIVKDTGRGLGESPTQAGGGVGLSNIRERLQALFGDAGKLILESNDPKGAKATIEVPVSHPSTMRPFSALDADLNGASRAASAKTGKNDKRPAGFAASTWWIARRTHSVWIRILTWGFVAIMMLLGVLLVVGLVGVATGTLPLQFFDTELTGLEGVAIGSLALLAVFCVLALVALIIVLLTYGLGVFFAFLAVAIPAIIVAALVPSLAPWVIFGFICWAIWKWYKKRKVTKIKP